MSATLRYAVGTDTVHVTADTVVAHLEARGYSVVRVGAIAGGDPLGWSDVGAEVARLVASGDCDGGVACCWTGTGVSIAANKIAGIRAALCADPATARGARRWNDANLLALGLAGTDADSARTILDAWLDVEVPDPEEADNIRRVSALERSASDPAASPA